MVINIIGYVLLAYLAFLSLGIVANIVEILFTILVGIYKYIKVISEILWDTRTFCVPVIMGVWFYMRKGNIVWDLSLFQDKMFIIFLVLAALSIVVMWTFPKLILRKWTWLGDKVYVIQMRRLSKQIDIPEEWRREDAKKGLYY